jgi:heme-degrading monooxygenase HmoA
MILEHVILSIKSGQSDGFEAAFREASPIIASMEGYLGHTLHQCIETADQYLLLVQWATLEAHTLGFRGSPEYQTWKALLHGFYEPFPTVEHYREVSLSPQ